MLDELYNSHEFNIDIFSYSSGVKLGTCYGAFTPQVNLPQDICREAFFMSKFIQLVCNVHTSTFIIYNNFSYVDSVSP